MYFLVKVAHSTKPLSQCTCVSNSLNILYEAWYVYHHLHRENDTTSQIFHTILFCFDLKTPWVCIKKSLFRMKFFNSGKKSFRSSLFKKCMKLIIFFFITLWRKNRTDNFAHGWKKLSVRFFLHNVMKKKNISFISYHLIMLFLYDKTVVPALTQ
jgi:hypothetical protein